MAGWHHRLIGREFEQALGDGEGQGSLVCCCPRGCKESDMTEQKREITSYIQRSPHKTISWLFSRNFKARRQWHEIFKMVKGKNLQPRILSRLSFRTKGEIKFPKQAEVKGVYHYKTDPTTNVQGTSLNIKRRPLLEIWKLWKKKTQCKGKHILKVVTQPSMQLVWRLQK